MKKNLITTSLLITLPTIALAQTPATELQEINVYSAYAVPVNQDKTASSVTVLTEKDFAERNATYVSDLLRTVPGVSIAASGGRGSLTALFLRGAESNHTAIIIDGVRVNPIDGEHFDFGGLPLSNIERIEILRGEQSALWGSNAIGGVVYITTKSGLYQNKPFNLDIDIGLGSHKTFQISNTLSGYHKGFYYSLQNNTQSTKGISAMSSHRFSYMNRDGSTTTTGGFTEKDAFNRYNYALRLGYDANNKGIETLVSHSSQVADFDDVYDRQETTYDDNTRTRETLLKLSGYFGNDQELFKHQISVSQMKVDKDTFTTEHLYDSNFTKTATIPTVRAYDAKKLNTSYQLDINFDREGSITQGISLLSEYQKANYHSTSYASEKALSEKSLAAEYRLFSENDHSLALSGRYTDNSQYSDAITGRISGGYRLSSNLRAHASMGSAIQNPSIIEYYGYYGTYASNPNLKPEKSLGGDIGLLIETNDKRHSLDTTYFARNIKDFIGSEKIDGNTMRAKNNDGTSKVKGVEITYQGKITKDLTAYGNYTYTQTKDSLGEELLRRPKHSANAGLKYQVTRKLDTSINLAYTGKRKDIAYPNIAKMPSYSLVNLGVAYKVTQNINLYVNLNNIFNKKYENVLGYGQDGRNIYLGLKGNF